MLVRMLKAFFQDIAAADYDLNKAQKGIIFIDEIDKITRKSDNPSITEMSQVKEFNKLYKTT